MHSVITEEDRSQTDTQQNKYKEEEDTMQTTQKSTEENQVKWLHILSLSRILYKIFIEAIADVYYLIKTNMFEALKPSFQ